MILKVGSEQSTAWSVFEAEVTPGFDVGAHLHQSAEELFYILDGELDLLAFEPVARTAGDWQSWQSASGARVMRGGPGSAMFVPAGCPHAFANPGTVPARMLFLVSPPGHEHYLDEIGEQIADGGPPNPEMMGSDARIRLFRHTRAINNRLARSPARRLERNNYSERTRGSPDPRIPRDSGPASSGLPGSGEWPAGITRYGRPAQL
jgi:mannose-6-phosphate isomerase-like protein (cupin superfamily)